MADCGSPTMTAARPLRSNAMRARQTLLHSGRRRSWHVRAFRPRPNETSQVRAGRSISLIDDVGTTTVEDRVNTTT